MRFLKGFLTNLLLFSVLNYYAQEITHEHSIYHSFLENKGQWPEQVLFKSQFNGGNMWVEQNKFMFHVQDFSNLHEAHTDPRKELPNDMYSQSLIHLTFEGSNKVSSIEKTGKSKQYYNYFIGNDESKWAADVHGYEEAVLKEFYDGIDLKLIEQKDQLKYEFHVMQGSDPSDIVLRYDGHEELLVDENGNLVVRTSLGNILEKKPYSYQIVNGRIKEVYCKYKVVDNKVQFELGEYDPYAVLVIDPVLVFATYAGSLSDNFGMTATYGYDGTAYSGGIVFGNSYPTPSPSWNTTTTITNVMSVANDPTGTFGVTDVFISKYSENGTDMLWTCFIGGGNDTQGTETVHSLICDTLNNIYLYGATSSGDFPFQNGYSNSHSGGTIPLDFTSNGVHHYTNGTDIYVSKLSDDGMLLLGSTYIGGSANDGVSYNNIQISLDSLTTNYGDQFRGEIMLDANNNVIVASCTKSTDFPVLNAFQSTNAGKQDGIIFKLSNDLSTLIWSSYFGGSENDACYSVKVDRSDNVLFAGGTSSNDLPGVSSGWMNAYNGGETDGFVMKIDPNASGLIGGTYLGTPNYDQAFFVEVDRENRVYVVGQSENGSFPVVNSGFENPGSSQFVTRLDSTLSFVLNSTVFGSGSNDLDISPSAFLVDICGNIYVSGWGKNLVPAVAATGMPITSNAYQSTTVNPDFYLIVLKSDFAGPEPLYATYIGGNLSGEHVDGGTSRFDKNGVVYQSVCGGCTDNSDFPTTPGAWSDQNLSDNCNNLVFKFDFELIPDAEFTTQNTLGCASFEVTFDNFSTDSDAYLWDFGNGDTSSVIFEPTIIYDTAGIYEVYLYVTDSICLLTDTAMLTITVTDSLEITTTVDQQLCVPTPLDLIVYTNGTATNFVWSSNAQFTDTLNTNLSDSIFNVTPTSSATYYVSASNPGCTIIDSVQIDFIGSSLTLSANDSICAGDLVTVNAQSTNPLIVFDTYDWGEDSIIVSPSTTNTVVVQPYTTQYVTVTASSITGCVVEDSIQIFVGNTSGWQPIASATETIIPEGGTTTLLAEPSGLPFYSWSPDELIDSPENQNTTVEVPQTTIYTLTVSDGICSQTDTVLVTTYEFICEDPYLFVPNAFSPNGDNENDILYVRGALISEMVFRIYDRWGELVFESFDRSTGWDGTFRGKPMDPDVYDYYLKVICINDDESIIKGNITLLK